MLASGLAVWRLDRSLAIGSLLGEGVLGPQRVREVAIKHGSGYYAHLGSGCLERSLAFEGLLGVGVLGAQRVRGVAITSVKRWPPASRALQECDRWVEFCLGMGVWVPAARMD